MKNKAFLETEEGKLLQKLQDCSWLPKTEETQDSLNTYLEGVFGLMEKIVNMGYAVVPEYESRLNQPKYMDQGLEKSRKEYEKKYYKKNPVQGKANEKRIDFPEVSVNGRKYKTYGVKGFMSDMEGIDFKGGEEVEKLFRELSDIYRKRVVVYGLYNLEEGMKSFVCQVYEKRYADQAAALENQLLMLLYDQNQNVRLYLRSHPELKARKELDGLYQKIEEQVKEEQEQKKEEEKEEKKTEEKQEAKKEEKKTEEKAGMTLSQFEYKEIKQEEMILEDVYIRNIGQETISREMRSEVKRQKGDFFKERFKEDGVFAYEELDKKIADTVKTSFAGRSVGYFEKSKRRDEAVNKIRLQRRLVREQELLAQKYEYDQKLARTMIRDTKTKRGGKMVKVTKEEQFDNRINREVYSSEEALAALREWLAPGPKSESLLNPQNQLNTFDSAILSEMDKLDISQFEYKNDEEFLSRFAEKYRILRKGAAAGWFLDKYLEVSKDEAVGAPITVYRAKVAFFKKMKEDYEDRMKLISSPYYSLLSQKDLSRYLKEDGEAAIESLQKEDLKEFVKLYRKLSTSDYGSGKNNVMRFEETLKILGDQRLEKDKPVLEKVIGNAKISGKKDVENFLENSFTQKKAELIATYSEDDHEFIQKVKPDVSGKVEGFDDKAIMEYEKILLGVFDSAKIEGKTISPEHMEGLKGKLHEYTELRREYFAVQKVCMELSRLQSGGLCDYQNPSLMESGIGKKLNMIMEHGHKKIGQIVKMQNTLLTKWRLSLYSCFSYLFKNGYSLSEKYEGRILNAKPEELEKVRMDVQNKRAKTAADKEKGKKSGLLDEKGEYHFVSMQVNGVSFTVYGITPLDLMMQGKEIKLEGENGKQLQESMKRHTDNMKNYGISMT